MKLPALIVLALTALILFAVFHDLFRIALLAMGPWFGWMMP